jgi:hypothetical protein
MRLHTARHSARHPQPTAHSAAPAPRQLHPHLTSRTLHAHHPRPPCARTTLSPSIHPPTHHTAGHGAVCAGADARAAARAGGPAARGAGRGRGRGRGGLLPPAACWGGCHHDAAVWAGARRAGRRPCPLLQVRATAARAMGSLLQGMGAATLGDLVPWLLATLRSEASAVERQGGPRALASGWAVAARLRLSPPALCLAQHPPPTRPAPAPPRPAPVPPGLC